MGKTYKDNDIVDLARFMANSHNGVTIEEIMEKYEISRRTAERRRDRVLEQFPDYEEIESFSDRKNRWKLNSNTLKQLLKFDFNDITTLELLKKELQSIDKQQFTDFINDMIEKVRIAQKKELAETDIEALMESEGFAIRQHPHFKVDEKILSDIREAILSFKKIKIKYNKQGKIVERIVHPYGVLHSSKSYLIGFSENSDKKGIKNFLLSKITELKILDEYFETLEYKEQGFDNFQEFASQSFGTYLNEPMDVKLRFSGKAIEDVKNYFFHPTQKITDNGSNVIVEFRASGEEAICWELFKWGEYVEILAPQKLHDIYYNKLSDIIRVMTSD